MSPRSPLRHRLRQMAADAQRLDFLGQAGLIVGDDEGDGGGAGEDEVAVLGGPVGALSLSVTTPCDGDREDSVQIV